MKQLINELNLEVKFEHEQDYWMDYIGDVDDPKDWQDKFERGLAEVLFAYVEGDGGEILASLGGIVVTCDADGRAYLEQIEEDLLNEAIEYLKRGAS